MKMQKNKKLVQAAAVGLVLYVGKGSTTGQILLKSKKQRL